MMEYATSLMSRKVAKLPQNVIIISGDRDFSRLISELKQCGFNTLSVMPEKALEVSGIAGRQADVIWTFEDFIKGLAPIFKKQTEKEKKEGQPLVGCISQLMGMVNSFQEERIVSSDKNLEVVFPEMRVAEYMYWAVKLGKIVEEKQKEVVDTLKKGVTLCLNKIEGVPDDQNKFYRLAGTHSSTLNVPFSTCPTAKDYPNEIWKIVSHDLVHNADLLNKLLISKNLYEAAFAFWNNCPGIQGYHLCHIISWIRIMCTELNWLSYNDDVFEISGVKNDRIGTFGDIHNSEHESQRLFPKRKSAINFAQPQNGKQTYVCWDFDSICEPSDKEIFNSITSKMISSLRNLHLVGPVTIKVFEKVGISDSFCEVLLAENVDVTKITCKQGRIYALNSKIPLEVGLLPIRAPSTGNFVFITDDDSRYEVMRNLKEGDHHNKIILVLSDVVPKLIGIADVVWLFHDFARGLPPFLVQPEDKVNRCDTDVIVMIAQILRALHALRIERSLPIVKKIKEKSPCELNVEIALQHACKYGAVTVEEHEQGWIYFPAHENLWLWI